MTSVAPVIGEVAGRVLDHPDMQIADSQGAPECVTRFARMRRGRNFAPVCDGEGQGWNLHGGALRCAMMGLRMLRRMIGRTLHDLALCIEPQIFANPSA